MNSLESALKNDLIIVTDGSMATSLYSKGFYINRSFEELNLTNRDSVRQVLEEFRKSGAKLLHTNTFGATRPKLIKHGIQDKLKEIVRSGVEIAKEAARNDVSVVGTLGPIGLVLEPLGPTSFDECVKYFTEIVEIMAKSGVDGYSIKSFHDFNELKAAVKAIRSVDSKAVILANIAIREDLKTSFGYDIKSFAKLSEELKVSALGFCGQVGPSKILSAVEELYKYTSLPISALPDAGMPEFFNDEYIYLCNPDYLAKYAKRFVQAGARIVGGHSGVDQNHTSAISSAIKMLQPKSEGTKIEIRSADLEQENLPECTELSEKSLLGWKLANGHPVISVELNPPKGIECKKFLNRCEELVAGGVEFVNIPDGARASARMSSLQLSNYVQDKFNLEVIPHFTCRDRNLIGLQSDLLGSYVNGIKNLLLVTGDPPKLGDCPDATAVYDVDAIGLTHIVKRMNCGLDLGGSKFGDPTAFVMGVALNPTTPNQELERKRFSYKVDAGAEYAVTQPIYDLEAYEKFFDKYKGDDIPIIMGIWPMVSIRNAEFLKYEVPGVSVPDSVIKTLSKYGDNKEDILKAGIEIAHKTIDKARDHVAGFAVSAPFNRASVALEVIRATTVFNRSYN